MDSWKSYESPDSRMPNSNPDNTTPKDSLGLGNGELLSGLFRGLGTDAGSRLSPILLGWMIRYPKLARLASFFGVVWFLSKYVLSNMHNMWTWLMSYAMVSVTISTDDSELYRRVRTWILKNKWLKPRRSLHALSLTHAANRNYAKIRDEDELKVIYKSNAKIQFFKHGSKWFIYTEEDSDTITLWCLGFSTKRIQDLLAEIQNDEDRLENTVVYGMKTHRSATNEFDTNGWPLYQMACEWELHSSAPRRTLESVCLNAQVKENPTKDIARYLHPNSARWYAQRGIPYRRGYLLFGKPGCGKTSFAKAVAGQFGLNVYALSLLDNGLTDTELGKLFLTLKPKSLVLLEDIDSAGIGREYTKQADELSNENNSVLADAAAGGSGTNTGTSNKTITGNPMQSRSQVTLSGLLNAIDGVSSPEGHILILSTNYPDNLDDALIRPGRVDIHVEFEYATKEQIHDMFIRMYTPYDSDTTAEYDISTLPALADHFSEIAPAGVFSPAEIQQHLLIHTRDPNDAIARVSEMIERKKKSNYSGAKSASLENDGVPVPETQPVADE
ncbi:hypothetical protein LTR99_008600 [Exophiala xenobiotica]|uniref:Mitochondrial chaperone BCS1 n=1 Tax=Vermiconidia calcicola TaxID=1690605 RepID=A0AAV9Q4V5_9PEZI|nr:hypothetical protein LTR92_008253 [Exophiala xenobiotica]KAK5532989.1 hypothetical protein LTR25_007694 [Vermiconidia calcicola]KAK5534323.1 hypothetical protein LTR23_008752 [Chaetothyriales sp. CCFEE 6169]KAK5211234.1 hypothetical protein LTR41_002693 [Exophiala xenobiotica]KAK5269937.1 hypothetical protein LTR96_004436 [Exophiala xenobiotica]